MGIIIKQVSSLEKIRRSDNLNFEHITNKRVMQGERLSYQVALKGDGYSGFVKVWCESEIPVRLYIEREEIIDLPATQDISGDENYITKEPGYIPDILVPADHQNNTLLLGNGNTMLWVKVDVPSDIAPGKYTVKTNIGTLIFSETSTSIGISESTEMAITVLPAVMPKQNLIYTRWFYADCIANAHGVEIFSEKHWELIESYIAAAVDVGINMILTPIHTPPLDTAIGTARPCVQLVDIQKNGDNYEFNFDKFRRFIAICKKQGVQYYEMAHLFSQWGAKCSPNIMVTENGKKHYLFGWHVSADSKEYSEFLKQYIAAVAAELEKEGISENTYFHISDEPDLSNFERYESACNIIKPLIGKSKTLDALYHLEFYQKGLISNPIPSVREVHRFIDANANNLWTYYCCEPQTVYPNSFLALPSSRVRILGFLLYKYNIKGFLHWGFNFYNCMHSNYSINPYITSSSDGALPSGDGFIVYPGKNAAYGSIRGEVTYQAIEDMRICVALEELIGRDEVLKMIDEAAGRNLRFDDYPCSNEFLEDLRDNIREKIIANQKH